MQYPNEHNARLIKSDEFQEDSLKRKNIEDGIDKIIGKLIGEEKTTIQSYRFDSDKFTITQSKKWLKENNIDFVRFEPALNPNEADRFTYPIFVFDHFDENLSRRLVSDLLYYETFYSDESIDEDIINGEYGPSKSKIKMWINSPGGYVSDLMSIIDTMKNIETPIETYCLGMCASCAGVLLANGTKGKRFIGKNSHVLLHQVSFGTYGNIQDIEKDIEQSKKLNNQIIDLLAEATGKDKETIRKDMERDLWLNAEEALEYGIVDKILDDNSNEIKSFMEKMEKKEKKNLNKKSEEKTVNAKFEIKSINEEKDCFKLKGYASDFDSVDLDDDVVCKGSFKKSLCNTKMLDNTNERSLLWQHNIKEVPLGKATLKEDNTGLFVQAILPKDDDFVNGRIIPQLKVGSIKNMSFGFKVKDYYYKDNIRYLTDIEIYEVSLVNFPANNKAKILSIKSAIDYQELPIADKDVEWDGYKAIKRIQELTNSEDSPSEDYKKGFLWYDKDKSNSFDSYHLPIVDVIDGRMQVVPEALFSAVKVIDNFGISNKDIDKVKANIVRYYKKMDLDNPFKDEKSFEFENITDVSKFIKQQGFTKKETDDIIYNLKKVFSISWKEKKKNISCNEKNNKSCNEICSEILNNISFINDKLLKEK